jgi:putative SOS response-associated peptidase YedK
MCNEYEQQIAWDSYCAMMQRLAWPVPADQSALDLPPAPSIRISDLGSAMVGDEAVRLTRMRFSWEVPNRGPMFNIRSDNPQLPKMTRALVPASAFFEFSGDKAPKSKHRVTLNPSAYGDAPFMAIAAAWKPAKGNLPATFAMVTVDPGPDMAPYHARQVAVLPPDAWKRWITEGAHELLRPLPGGSLTVKTIRKGSGNNTDSDAPPPAQGALL